MSTPESELNSSPKSDIDAFDNALTVAVDRQLFAHNITSIALLEKWPTDSMKELAIRLGKGASGHGLETALYRDAQIEGRLRDVAIDQLFRTLRYWFPHGFCGTSKSSLAAPLGIWASGIKRRIDNAHIRECIAGVVKYMMEDPPESGWFPDSIADEYLSAAFEYGWPQGLHD